MTFWPKPVEAHIEVYFLQIGKLLNLGVRY